MFLLLATLAGIANGKRWGMCELAREMHSNGFPRNQLDNWMCLVNSESSYEQNTIGRLNADGSKDWGLFQISDIYWCQDSKSEDQRFFGSELKCRFRGSPWLRKKHLWIILSM